MKNWRNVACRSNYLPLQTPVTHYTKWIFWLHKIEKVSAIQMQHQFDLGGGGEKKQMFFSPFVTEVISAIDLITAFIHKAAIHN